MTSLVRYRKIFFYKKKALATSMPKISIIYSATLLQYQLMTVTQDRQRVRKIYLRHSSPPFNAVSSLQIASPCSKMFTDIMLVTLLLFVFTLPFSTRIIFYLPVFYHTFRSCNQVAVCQPLLKSYLIDWFDCSSWQHGTPHTCCCTPCWWPTAGHAAINCCHLGAGNTATNPQQQQHAAASMTDRRQTAA